MRDHLKQELLQSMEKYTQYDNAPMGKFEAYCTYHQ